MQIQNAAITGSFTYNGVDISSITGSTSNITSLNAITASIFSTTASLNTASGSAITRLSALEVTSGSNITRISALETASGSAITRLGALEVTSGSNITRLGALETASGSAITRLSSLEAKTGSYATTGSNTFVGSQTITGSIFGSGSLTINGCITATGQIVAQTINVQQVTSSIVYSCGSNTFGTALNNSQTFTGSMFITGSNIAANISNACFAGAICAPAFVGGTVNGTTSTFVSGIISSTPANTSSLLLENFNGDQTATTLKLKSGRSDVFYHMQAFSGNTTEVFRIESSGRVVSAAGACFAGAVCVGTNLIVRSAATFCDTVGLFGGSSQLYIGATSNASDFAILSWCATNKSLNIQNQSVGSGPQLIVACNGKVGVAVSDPIVQFHVKTTVASESRPTNLATSATNSAVYFTTIGGSTAGIAFGQIGANTNYIQATYENGSASTPLSLNPYGGNVGIGATSPSSLLHICGAGTGVMLRLQNTSTVSGDQGPLIQFMSANQVGGQNFESGYIQSIWTNEGNGFGMRFATKAVDGSQVEHIRITSGGNVGIGTTDPNYKLRVEGTLYSLGAARFNGVVFSDCRLMVGVAGNDQTYASVFVGGALTSGTSQYALLLDPQLSGTTNYGILANARIKASTAATNAYGVFIINNELLSGASIVNNYGLYIANQTSGTTLNYAIYSAGGANYFGGNVGIGNSSPMHNLDINSVRTNAGGFAFCNMVTGQGVWSTFACVGADANVVTTITYTNTNDHNRSGVFVARWSYNDGCASLFIRSCLWNDSQNIATLAFRNHQSGALQICVSGGGGDYRVQALTQGTKAT